MSAPVTIPLARRLLASGALNRAELHRALVEHVSRRVPLPRALLDAGVLSEHALEAQLSKSAAIAVTKVAPLASLLAKLPDGLCARLLAVPIRIEASTGQVDVAAVDPFDRHVEAELSHHLGTKVRVVRASLAAVEGALRAVLSSTGGDRSSLAGGGARPGTASAPPSLHPPRPPSLPDIELLDDSDFLGDEGTYDEDEQPVLLLSQLKASPSTAEAVAVSAPKALDVSTVAALLRRAGSRDEVMDALLGGLRAVARRVGIFAVRKQEVQGFRCNDELAEPRELRDVTVLLEGPSIFATALATGCYVGPVPFTPAHAGLLRAIHGTSGDVAMLPITVSGKHALLVFLDDLGDVIIATRRAEDLGRLAGEALARLLAEGKR